MAMQFDGKANGHQGDVQFFSLVEVPANAKKIDKNFFAKSERSGHAHALTGDYELFAVDGKPENGFIIKVGTEGAILNHAKYAALTKNYWDANTTTPIADHKPSALTEGIYYVGMHRQVDPFRGIMEQVRD